jgi:hypothetical protein
MYRLRGIGLMAGAMTARLCHRFRRRRADVEELRTSARPYSRLHENLEYGSALFKERIRVGQPSIGMEAFAQAP